MFIQNIILKISFFMDQPTREVMNLSLTSLVILISSTSFFYLKSFFGLRWYLFFLFFAESNLVL